MALALSVLPPLNRSTGLAPGATLSWHLVHTA